MEIEEQDRSAVVGALADTLFVTLRTDLRQTGPSAVQEYAASIQVQWSPDEGPDVDLEVLSELTDVDTEGYLPELDKQLPDVLAVPVGRGRFVVADLAVPSCWQELVGRSLDLGLVGEALLGETFDLSELRASYDVIHERALILDSVEIDPRWRGAGYGLRAAELGIQELGKCVDLAALFPMRPGVVDLEERAQAAEALTRYWARLGFVDYNGIMVREL